MKRGSRSFVFLLSLIHVLSTDGCMIAGNRRQYATQQYAGPAHQQVTTTTTRPPPTTTRPPTTTTTTTTRPPTTTTTTRPPTTTTQITESPHGASGGGGVHEGKPGICPYNLNVHALTEQCSLDAQCPGPQRCCPVSASGRDNYCAETT